jgi:hypothetical protein
MNMTPAQEENARKNFVEDLKKQKAEIFALKWLFDDIPFIFPDAATSREWKIRIAKLNPQFFTLTCGFRRRRWRKVL